MKKILIFFLLLNINIQLSNKVLAINNNLELKNELTNIIVDKELLKTFNKFWKYYENLETQNEKLLEKNKTLDNTLKDRNKYIKTLEKSSLDKDKKINNQQLANKELIELNNQKINLYQTIIDDNILKYNSELNKKNEEINSLINLNEELNRKIVNQNNNIINLENINNQNSIKYKNDLDILIIKLNNSDKNYQKLNNNYNNCIDDKNEIIVKQNGYLNIMNKKNVLVNIVIILTIIISIFNVIEISKKM